jgi:hypothetical protein
MNLSVFHPLDAPVMDTSMSEMSLQLTLKPFKPQVQGENVSLCLLGPGCGKTQVSTWLTLYLISEAQRPPVLVADIL